MSIFPPDDNPHVGDIGTAIIFAVTRKDPDTGVVAPVNLSAANGGDVGQMLIRAEKPVSGTRRDLAVVYRADGVNGEIMFVTTVATDLDEVGDWRLQAKVNNASGEWWTWVQVMSVDGVIAAP